MGSFNCSRSFVFCAFSGLAPGFVGVWQINAFVPANSVSGKVPVFVKLDNGLTSNHVSIWVQ